MVTSGHSAVEFAIDDVGGRRGGKAKGNHEAV